MGNIGSHVDITSGWRGHQAKMPILAGALPIQPLMISQQESTGRGQPASMGARTYPHSRRTSMRSVAQIPRLSIASCLAALLAGAFARADAADLRVDAIMVKPASPGPS
jgi:hypothetical protein